jgi:hypothetical protein
MPSWSYSNIGMNAGLQREVSHGGFGRLVGQRSLSGAVGKQRIAEAFAPGKVDGLLVNSRQITTLRRKRCKL